MNINLTFILSSLIFVFAYFILRRIIRWIDIGDYEEKASQNFKKADDFLREAERLENEEEEIIKKATGESAEEYVKILDEARKKSEEIILEAERMKGKILEEKLQELENEKVSILQSADKIADEISEYIIKFLERNILEI